MPSFRAMNRATAHQEGVLERVVPLGRPVDLRTLLGPLVRGAGDPTMRVAAAAAIRASVTPEGPGAIEIRIDGAAARARTWGPGAAFLLDGLPALLGLDDDPFGFDPSLHPVVAQLARRHGPVRLGRTVAVWDALLPAILEQRITGTEAWRNHRRLVRAHGAPAPGPLGLVLAPTPATVAGLPSWRLTALGIEPRRGLLLRRISREATRYESLAAPARATGAGGAAAAALTAALLAQPGIGPWTAAEVALRALGDADAVSVGDFHLPNIVAYALAGEIRGTDARMLELLEPWRGQRARVVRLLELSGLRPPAFGPRYAPRSIAAI